MCIFPGVDYLSRSPIIVHTEHAQWQTSEKSVCLVEVGVTKQILLKFPNSQKSCVCRLKASPFLKAPQWCQPCIFVHISQSCQYRLLLCAKCFLLVTVQHVDELSEGLVWASQEGCLEDVVFLLRAGVKVNSRNQVRREC